MHCRLCNSRDLHTYLDLGFTPPADGFLRPDQLDRPEDYYPLRVQLCAECGLSQLDHVVSAEILYRRDYPYEASVTKTGRAHWNELAESAIARFRPEPGQLVVDIGSNVGVLLDAFRSRGLRVLGVDPAMNIVRIAEKNGIETVAEFFSPTVATRIVAQSGTARIITATNVFAHVDNVHSFMKGVATLLSDDGVFIVEFPHFKFLVDHLEYDTIYHEHLSYFTVRPLVKFFSAIGFEIFDIEERDLHGGSLRLYVGRHGVHSVQPSVQRAVEEEHRTQLFTLDTLTIFAKRVEENRRQLTWLISRLKQEGKKVAAVSAPAKGMTLLNYCRFGPETVEFVTEKSALKIGRVTPGLHIPVVSDDSLLIERPDYCLLLAWNFAAEIMNNLKEYRRQGGRFIIPIPEPRIVS